MATQAPSCSCAFQSLGICELCCPRPDVGAYPAASSMGGSWANSLFTPIHTPDLTSGTSWSHSQSLEHFYRLVAIGRVSSASTKADIEGYGTQGARSKEIWLFAVTRKTGLNLARSARHLIHYHD